MTHGPPPHDRPPGEKPMWPGFLLGFFVVAPAVAFLAIAIQTGMGIVSIAVVVGAFVLLFQRDRFLRGIGTGVLAAIAVALIVLFVACYQYIQDTS